MSNAKWDMTTVPVSKELVALVKHLDSFNVRKIPKSETFSRPNN